MVRAPNTYCYACGALMSRMYIRPTGSNPKPIGYVCQCGEVKFDDNRGSPMAKAWAHLKRGGGQ